MPLEYFKGEWFSMPETISVVKQETSFKGFLKMALDAVEDGIESIANKGIGVRFSADYTNSVVDALKLIPEFKAKSETEIKLALQPLFKAVILNAVARELKVIEE
jgi:hypothetical protein